MASPAADNGHPPASPEGLGEMAPPWNLNRPGISDMHYMQDVLEADQSQSDSTSSQTAEDGSCSITASIIEYEYENGRRYHAYKAGHYPLPNDERELDRLDLQHHVFKLLLHGELFLAPLQKHTTRRVLDLGTGTGLWAIEFADEFPEAMVTGVDLSPVQPIWVPDNLRFEIDDVDSEWMRPENYFDYVHSRIMVGAIDDWQRLIRRAYKHLRPGGWLEFQDLDPTLTSDDGTHEKSVWHLEFMAHLERGARKYGKVLPYVPDFERWMAAAGFVDIKTTVFKLPMNSWPKDKHLKEVGKYQFHNYHEGYEAISIGLFTRALGWTADEFQVLLAKVRAELRDRSIHTYEPFVVCYGRKPFPHEEAPRSHHAPKHTSQSSTADADRQYTRPPIAPEQAIVSHPPFQPNLSEQRSPDGKPTKNPRGIPIESLLSPADESHG